MSRKLKKLPKGCRAGYNANAFLGGFRLWENYQSLAAEGSFNTSLCRTAGNSIRQQQPANSET